MDYRFKIKKFKRKVNKKLEEATQVAVNDMNNELRKKYYSFLKKIIISGVIVLVFFLALIVITNKSAEKRVNEKTTVFFENQKVEFENKINRYNDSISRAYKVAFERAILSEKQWNDSVMVQTMNQLNKEFKNKLNALIQNNKNALYPVSDSLEDKQFIPSVPKNERE